MKKSLAKKITLSILAGAVLMSSSVVWAAGPDVYSGTGSNSFYVGFSEDSTGFAGSKNSVVVGREFEIVGNRDVILGVGAQIEGNDSVAIGSGSVANASNVVSVGAGGPSGGTSSVDLDGDGNKETTVPNTRSIINVTDIADWKNTSQYGSYVVNVNTLNEALSEISSTSGNVYTKTETDNLLNAKADANSVYSKNDANSKFATISSLGDYAKTTDMNTALNGKANSADVYTKGEVYAKTETDNLLNAKADANSVYSMSEADSKFATISSLGDYAKTTDMSTALNGKADKATNLAGYGITDAYTKAEVYAKTETYSQAEVNTKLDGKADKATTLAGYGITDAYTKAEVDGMLGGSSTAINGINQRLDKTNAKINKVGAGAAALAALHPLDYDPDDKLTFSAGMGNYAGENAAALGAFYRPNEKFMLSLGGTMGNGENMVNLGLSIGLDKPNGFAKLSKRELIQKVNVMEAKYEQVEAENEAMKAEIAEMKTMLQELLAKK